MRLIRNYQSGQKTKFIATFKIKKEGYDNFVNMNIRVFALDDKEAERKARAELKTWKNIKKAYLIFIENTATGDIT